LVITSLLLLWMVRMVLTWRHWWREPAQSPRGWRRMGAVAWPVIVPLGWALLLLVGIPQALYPLAVMRINIPDFGYSVLGSGVLALGWSILWAGLIFFAGSTSIPNPNNKSTI